MPAGRPPGVACLVVIGGRSQLRLAARQAGIQGEQPRLATVIGPPVRVWAGTRSFAAETARELLAQPAKAWHGITGAAGMAVRQQAD